MIRFLIRFLLLTVIVGGGGMFVAQWLLKSNLKDFTNKVRPYMDFSYDSASIGFNGEVSIRGIKINVQSAAAKIDVGLLQFYVGNLYQLAVFRSNIEESKLPEEARFVLKNVLFPFESKVLKQLDSKKMTTSFDVMETAFCGPVHRFGLREFEAMGYSYLSFSSETIYHLDKYSGSVIIKGKVDIEDVNKIEYQVNIGGVLSWIEELTEKMSDDSTSDSLYITPQLSFLELRTKDQGYNLRKAEYCDSQENATTDYYSGHLAELEEILSDAGVSVPKEFKPLYFEFIQPDSLISLQVQPKVSFDFKNIMNYDYSQFLESSGLQLSINDKPVNLMLADWSLAKFEKVLKLANIEQFEEEKKKPKYESKIISRKYQKVSVSSLDSYVHSKAKILRNDGQRFDGKIERTSSDKVWLLVHSKKGDIILPFKKNSIKDVEVYKEVSGD